MGDQSAKDFSRFDAMSTEELNMFLRGYLNAPNIEEDSAEMDAVLYVMEVIAKREKGMPLEAVPNVNDAWRDFMENYYPKAKTSEKDARKTVQINAHDKTPARKVHRWRSMSTLSRVASIAIMVLVLGFAGMGVAQAAGYDVFGAVATWTADIFTFRERGGNLEVNVPTSHEPDGSGSYASLQDALDAYGITSPIAPKWIPEGYAAESVTATTTEYGANISAIYMSQEKQPGTDVQRGIEVSITYDISGTMDYHVQKDEDAPEVYEKNGVEYYLMTNMGNSTAVWQQGSCKCGISSNSISAKDLKAIIDSIYWRS